ncbi:MAG: TetR/AcrR family transcriptional regulator [Candidatus Izemoplasmataceae bacterium]
MPKDTFHRLKDEKKAHIKKGLLEVYNHLGYDQATIADIIKACEIPRGSFYQYFEGKLDTFMYLIDEAQKDKIIYLEPLLKKIGKEPFLEIYTDIFALGIKFAKDNPEAFKLTQILYKSHDKAIQAIWQSLETQAVSMYKEFLIKDYKAGHIKKEINIELVAKMLYRLISVEVVEEFLISQDEEKLLALATDMITILKHGIKEKKDENSL